MGSASAQDRNERLDESSPVLYGDSELTKAMTHIFDTIREPLIILNGSDLQVRLANSAYYETFQTTKVETEGQFVYDLGNGQWRIAALQKLLEETLPKVNKFNDFEVEYNFETIGPRTMLLNARRIDHGRLILLAIEDITDRKRIELDLRRSNKDLEQFACVASHDLKEPLRTIATHLALLEKSCEKLDEEDAQSIRFAVDGAKRMATLVDNLLAYSALGKRPRIEPVDLNEAFDHACFELNVCINEAGAVVTKSKLPTIKGDSTELVQLFENLISNGVKYRSKDAPQVRVSVEKRPREWLFSVQDNGIGIPQENRERVFEMFQRLHSASEYPGVGIGLAICKKIVESLGGRIWVESDPSRGSTFFFTLPV